MTRILFAMSETNECRMGSGCANHSKRRDQAFESQSSPTLAATRVCLSNSRSAAGELERLDLASFCYPSRVDLNLYAVNFTTR